MRVSWKPRTLAKPTMLAAVVGLALPLAPVMPALAEETPPGTAPQDTPGEIAREGLEQMMRALRLLVESIPQYELPEVLENGDIIIRRKHLQPESEEPEFDETAT